MTNSESMSEHLPGCEDVSNGSRIPKPDNRTAKPRPIWLFMLISVVSGFGLFFVVSLAQWLKEKQTQLLFIGLDGMCFYLTIGLTCTVTAIIVAWFIPKSRRKLTLSAAIVLVACYVTAQFLRIDGYNGDRTPRLVWRWAPKAEDKIKTYLTSRTINESALATDILFETTDGDFPELLGQKQRSRVDQICLRTDWIAEPPKLLWQHPVGLGWSSFSIVGSAAVNMEQRDDSESVVCYNIHTGIELWSHGEKTRFNHEHGDGPRTTPTIRNGRVFSMGATGILTCVDLRNGRLLWKQSVFESPETQNLIFGMSGSPLVVQEMVIVTPGAGKGAAAIAYNVATGDEIWRSGDDPASYASPSLVSIGAKPQILSFNGAGLRSYGLDGREYWLHPWVTQGDSRVNVAQPILLGPDELDADELDVTDGNMNDSSLSAKILISSGYDRGTALLKVSRSDDEWRSEVLWESKHLKSKLSNVVAYRNYGYGFDNGILTCIDLKTGDRMWKRGRYGHGKLLLVKDKLLVQAESGEIVLVAATPERHIELSKFEALSSKTWNYLALANNILVVRNDQEAAAYELPVN